MTPFSTLFALPPRERRLAVLAVSLVIVLRLVLWILPSRIILRSVRALGRARPRDVVPGVDPATVTWAVEAAGRRVPHATCLTRAIAAQLLLLRYGFASRLCLGVAHGRDAGFRAHAWLERDGTVVIGAHGVRDMTRLPDLAWPEATFDSRGRV
ncbi:MAG: lasso peptide biosynthesis B2 protein [Gemmatimonadaceae bacterium]